MSITAIRTDYRYRLDGRRWSRSRWHDVLSECLAWGEIAAIAWLAYAYHVGVLARIAS